MAEKEKNSSGGLADVRVALGRFFHDLATPLSGVGLHLELASRRLARGEDATEAPGVARREPERASELFGRGRAALPPKDPDAGTST